MALHTRIRPGINRLFYPNVRTFFSQFVSSFCVCSLLKGEAPINIVCCTMSFALTYSYSVFGCQKRLVRRLCPN
jgi:hypothetical protein